MEKLPPEVMVSRLPLPEGVDVRFMLFNQPKALRKLRVAVEGEKLWVDNMPFTFPVPEGSEGSMVFYSPEFLAYEFTIFTQAIYRRPDGQLVVSLILPPGAVVESTPPEEPWEDPVEVPYYLFEEEAYE